MPQKSYPKSPTMAKTLKRYNDENKEEFKKLAKKVQVETFRHFDVIAEDLNGKIQLIAEQYGSVQESLEIIKDNLEVIKSDLHRKVDYEEFASLERRVNLLEKKAF